MVEQIDTSHEKLVPTKNNDLTAYILKTYCIVYLRTIVHALSKALLIGLSKGYITWFI